jgi:acetyltransferase-like isoleucine patch superfamily enzyme
MQNILSLSYKLIKRVIFYLRFVFFSRTLTLLLMYLNKVTLKDGFSTTGIPFISVSKGGKASIGKNFRIHNTLAANPIGRSQKSVLVVGNNGMLIIGDNVGMSFTAINCKKLIQIKDNVLIGGGTCIYDSDFHPLNALSRISNVNDDIATASVIIEENVFIGTNSTILKGVTIGKNSIVGACSVVTKDIPADEIWAGNPAKFIRSI